MHKYAGVAFQYAVALHVAAVGFSYLTFRPCLPRITGSMGQIALVLPYAALVGGVAWSVNPNGVPKFPDWYSPPLTKKVEAPKKAE